MTTIHLGNGLPSGITPRRVKSILGFVKSQVREFEDSLNQIGGPIWKKIPPDIEFYERIQTLLQSVEGRTEFGKARNRFEQHKPKRKGRADFYSRLKQDCLKSISQYDQASSEEDNVYAPNDQPPDLDVFARNNAWEPMAGYVWAQSVESGTGTDIATALEIYPQLSPFLTEVKVSPNSSTKVSNEPNDQTSKEFPGEVEDLIKIITEDVQSLEPNRLDSRSLTRILHTVNRLTAISDIRQDRKKNSSALKSCIAKWQKSNSEGISNTPGLGERIESLSSMIEYLEISIEELRSILTGFQKFIDMTQREAELQGRCYQAIDNKDYNSIKFISDELRNLEDEANAHLELIDKELSKLGSIAKTTLAFSPLSGARLAVANRDTSVRHTDQENIIYDGKASVGELHTSKVDALLEDNQVPEDTYDENYAVEPLKKDTGSDVAIPNKTKISKERNLDKNSDTQVRETIAREISKGRYAFAYHLAQAGTNLFPTPNVIKLIATNYVRRDFVALSTQFPTIANDVADDLNAAGDSLQLGVVALIASAALAPARISTGGPISQLLLSLEPFLREEKSFWTIVRKAAAVSLNGIQLNSFVFSEGDREEHWKARLQDLCKETREWFDVEQNTTIRYKPATDVWRRILDEWSHNDRDSIGLLLSQFQFKQVPEEGNIPNIDIDNVELSLNYWRQEIEREIDRIDRECRQITKFRPIDGPARHTLRSKICQALDLIDRWCTLYGNRRSLPSNYHLKQVEELRRIVYQHWQAAVNEISKIDSVYAPRVLDLFHRYISFFDTNVYVPPIRDLSIADLLHGELLADEEFELSDGSETPLNRISLERILSLSLQDDLNFKETAVARSRNHDFRGAELAVDFAVRRGLISEQEEDSVRREVDRQRKRSEVELEQRIDDVNARLGAAYARGVVSTKEFEDLQRQVPPQDGRSGNDFRRLLDDLDNIDGAISGFKDMRVDELRCRAESIEFRDSSDRKRINSAISEGRYLVAEDFLDRVVRGEGLPDLSVSQHRTFDRFYPEFVDEYTAFRDDQDGDLDQICRAIKDKKNCGPVDGKRPPSETRDAENLIEYWMRLLRGHPNKELVRSLFGYLGFSVRDTKIELNDTKSYEDFVAHITTDVISDKNLCQLPEFGSHAAGHYRVLFIRNRNTIQAIKQKTDALIREDHPPLIVAYLNCLDTCDRRLLTSQFGFRHQPPMLVLDDVLIAFLALESPTNRLSAFFNCTSAFTYASPYNPDTPAVPPEMFFGRTEARRRIRSHDDASHLVFGGRRLGKTALLKSIESEADPSSKDQIILYMDLNGTGVGQQRPVDDIWKVLATHLSDKIASLRNVTRTDAVRTKIKSWIKRKSTRRLLVLLDEADKFLESDRRQKHKYRVLSQIKDLMDQTNRQFKVVFSGLHNVQRSSRDPNTPLAHLGTPIQIGPMLPDWDGFEIENLIRQPLEALGYRFTSNDDVTQIAIETNYYPALAQQFCKELLIHLREGESTGKDEGPPFVIPSNTIRHFFDSKETLDRLRNIFSWTIQLDPRYEFLTFLIARQSLRDANLGGRGVSLSEICEIALSEWPSGFAKDGTFLTFEVLLEEMIGLGVLREVSWSNSANLLGAEVEQVQDRHFSIRTRSLRVLLGNDAEIERRYEDSKARTIPTLEPSRFRRTIDDVYIAPLTAWQEEVLLFDQFNVGLVFGTQLSGVDQVPKSLSQAARDMEGAPRPEVIDEDLIFSRINEISRSKRENNIALIVELRDFTDITIINRVKKAVERLETREKRVRVVFICGPLAAWSWQFGTVPTGNSGLKITWLTPCSIDFAHLWLKDNEIRAFFELEDEDLVHMPWPVVLSVAAKSKHSSLKSAEKETFNECQNLVGDVLEIPVAKAVLKALSDLNATATVDDILYWLEESASEQDPHNGSFFGVRDLERVLEWAMRLSVVNKVTGGYVLDPTYLTGIRLITSK